MSTNEKGAAPIMHPHQVVTATSNTMTNKSGDIKQEINEQYTIPELIKDTPIFKLVSKYFNHIKANVSPAGKIVNPQGQEIDFEGQVCIYNSKFEKNTKIVFKKDELRAAIKEFVKSKIPLKRKNGGEKDCLFRFKDNFVQIFIKNKDDDSGCWQNICSPIIEIFNRTSSLVGENCGRLLQWEGSRRLEDGSSCHKHTWAMPMELLAGDGRELRAYLLARDVQIVPGQERNLNRYLMLNNPTEHKISVDKIGWVPDLSAYVRYGKTYGDQKYIFQNRNYQEFKIIGTLPGWNEYIGCYAIGNSRLIIGLSIPISSAFLRIVGAEGGAWHFHERKSSIGKSTTSIVASTVCGTDMGTWRLTDNFLEGDLARNCDATVVYDDIGQQSKNIYEVGYLVGDQQTKGRANQVGGPGNRHKSNCQIISNGEQTLEDKIKEDSKKKIRGGQEVRFVNIPADCGKGYGIFEKLDFSDIKELTHFKKSLNLKNFSNLQEFSKYLREASKKYCGTPFDAILNKIIDEIKEHGVESLINDIKKRMVEFAAGLNIKTASGQVHRVVDKFAFVAACGEFSIDASILWWPKGTANWGIRQCFNAWFENFSGKEESSETARGIAQIRWQLESFESRFQLMEDKCDTYIPPEKWGYRNKDKSFFVIPDVLEQKILEGYDCKSILKACKEKGYLDTDGEKRLKKLIRIPGTADDEREWMYAFNKNLFDWVKVGLDNEPYAHATIDPNGELKIEGMSLTDYKEVKCN